ncbi:hypothetical protein F4780DRAFT_658624 [Xylariomycetidae sp. FL0641]|nr:hypothetical protein F4780DRAFT_658624 [Xylariomycetidae sp. FL0641]
MSRDWIIRHGWDRNESPPDEFELDMISKFLKKNLRNVADWKKVEVLQDTHKIFGHSVAPKLGIVGVHYVNTDIIKKEVTSGEFISREFRQAGGNLEKLDYVWYDMVLDQSSNAAIAAALKANGRNSRQNLSKWIQPGGKGWAELLEGNRFLWSLQKSLDKEQEAWGDGKIAKVLCIAEVDGSDVDLHMVINLSHWV